MTLALGALGVIETAAAPPVWRVVKDSAGAANLLRNPGFEIQRGNAFPGWRAAPQGFQPAPAGGRGGSRALLCVAPDAMGWRGASQTLTLNQPTPAPLVISGWSRAEGVDGGRDRGYSLYVDLIYADGTPLWGQTADFSAGAHDWERRELTLIPAKPVKSLTLHCLFRGHAGRVWFDDLRVTEIKAGGDAVLLQGTPMQRGAGTAPREGAPARRTTADGLTLELRGHWVTDLQIGGRACAGPVPGGFFARDVAADSDLFGFAGDVCPELDLRLETKWETHPDHLAVRGRLRDLRGTDRAILLLFALPIEAAGWTWEDDIRRHRPISGRGEFSRVNTVRCGSTGTMSAYPLAAIHDDRTGLALALDMGKPAQYRLVYHAGARQFFIACDFGLVPDTEQFPGGAEFRFVVYRFAPQWGFRAAWEKLMHIFPGYFQVRSHRQGIWMPFTDISTVQGWEDFGFRYHEGINNVAWDDAHDILSFRYTEPMTWWMAMDPHLPRTEAEAVRIRDQYARSGSGRKRQMAQVSRAAAMYEANGHPALVFRNTPWANGAVWSLNPNPHLPARPNAATVYWNDTIKKQAYGCTTGPRRDGEYLDSLEGYVTAELNFRREHFRYTTVPLTFATDTRQPALFKGLAVYEFTRWMSEDVHRAGGLMFANSVPHRFGFLCPWLDVMGTETDWMRNGKYQPVPDARLCLWRTLCGAKPYLLLMNTDYDRFTPHWVERYFQQSLFYGFLPSMFSHNAAENPYWKNPAWYNRDRSLFKKYIPVIRRVAEAGWEPVTAAVCDNSHLLVERFGPDASGTMYFTLLNDSERSRRGRLRVTGLKLPARVTATELLSGRQLAPEKGGWPVTLAPRAATAVKLAPAPH
jgi:hypothetical protein